MPNDLGAILVTGANGQIGSELSRELKSRYARVITSDIKDQSRTGSESSFVKLDVTNYSEVERVAKEFKIETFFHLAAILSAKGEQEPHRTFDVNMEGLLNVLRVASERKAKVFWPSSIAVFGPDAPKINTPQNVPLNPITMYGITKVSGELACNYYREKYSLDVRSVRLPGIVSAEVVPSGGTTDYAVEMLHAASRDERYECFVNESTTLPMMYMPDCMRAIVMIMEASRSTLRSKSSYNLSGLSFSARELASEIQKRKPNFECEFKPDYRSTIAETWPHSIDDSASRVDWNWKPTFNLQRMVDDVLEKLTK